MRWKILCNLRWIPVKDQLLHWAQRLAFVNGVLNISSQIFRWTAQRRPRHSGQCKVLKLQPFRSVLDPIRDQCCFLSCAQISKIQEVTDQRIGQYWCAWTGITLALEIQSPRTVRTCHSVGTTCSREAGTNSSGRRRLLKLWKHPHGFLATQEGPLAVVIFPWGRVPLSTTKSFLILVPKWENAYRPKFDILPRPSTNGTVAIWLLFAQSFWLTQSVTSQRSWDSFSWALTECPAIVLVKSPQLFSCSNIRAATRSPCRSRMAFK